MRIECWDAAVEHHTVIIGAAISVGEVGTACIHRTLRGGGVAVTAPQSHSRKHVAIDFGLPRRGTAVGVQRPPLREATFSSSLGHRLVAAVTGGRVHSLPAALPIIVAAVPVLVGRSFIARHPNLKIDAPTTGAIRLGQRGFGPCVVTYGIVVNATERWLLDSAFAARVHHAVSHTRAARPGLPFGNTGGMVLAKHVLVAAAIQVPLAPIVRGATLSIHSTETCCDTARMSVTHRVRLPATGQQHTFVSWTARRVRIFGESRVASGVSAALRWWVRMIATASQETSGSRAASARQ